VWRRHFVYVVESIVPFGIVLDLPKGSKLSSNIQSIEQLEMVNSSR